MSAVIKGRPTGTTRKVAERYLGQYVFLYALKGRSMPGDIIQVTDTDLAIRESNHDRWPDTLTTVKLEDIFELITCEESEDACGESTEVFSVWRSMLNGPDDEAWAESRAKEAREKAAKMAAKEAKILRAAKALNAAKPEKKAAS